jgi:hypothetical protein
MGQLLQYEDGSFFPSSSMNNACRGRNRKPRPAISLKEEGLKKLIDTYRVPKSRGAEFLTPPHALSHEIRPPRA